MFLLHSSDISLQEFIKTLERIPKFPGGSNCAQTCVSETEPSSVGTLPKSRTHRNRCRRHQTLTSTTLISCLTVKSFLVLRPCPSSIIDMKKSFAKRAAIFFFGKRNDKHFFSAILHFSALPTRGLFVCDSFSSDDDDEMEMEMCRRIG